MVEKSKIAKLLMLSEGGILNTQKGKSLADIELPEVPEFEEVMDQYTD